VAHGGATGAVVEALVVLAVISFFVSVWFRERQARRDRSAAPGADLRDDDEVTPS
jgi:hypothetical protein